MRPLDGLAHRDPAGLAGDKDACDARREATPPGRSGDGLVGQNLGLVSRDHGNPAKVSDPVFQGLTPHAAPDAILEIAHVGIAPVNARNLRMLPDLAFQPIVDTVLVRVHNASPYVSAKQGTLKRKTSHEND